MSVVGAREISEVRRHHLALLAHEAEARGLRWRLAGPEESVLSLVGPYSRRQVMVVATPVGGGWSYLWPGGGMADVSQVTDVADQIQRMLG
ncbi:hypothetical protein [Actinomadura hibisca]|uniref:hypothetical protein n=1 Tax=Actinomadura hibisca TaxID=68565 RepID=UPI000833D581|nr:hypothetical protein [Actinomadura hibisca]